MGDMNFTGSPLAVAVTAAVFSPRVRQVLHRGAVHGLAGVLIAGDAVTSFARGIGRGLQEASTTAAGQDSVEPPAASAANAAEETPQAAQGTAKATQKASTKPRAPKPRNSTARPKADPKTEESGS